MNVAVVGCGRWGSLIAWYLNGIGQRVALYGRCGSERMQRLIATRQNDLLRLPEEICLTTDRQLVSEAAVVAVSVPSQKLRETLVALEPETFHGKTVLLCMKGIEADSGERLSQVASELLPPDCDVAVWLGPGHVQNFLAGIPSCMVIDAAKDAVKTRLIEAFSGPLIRFYYGSDLIGNEIGAAAKNVVGLAAGMLDGFGLSTLKGPLMARGAREVARLIVAMGGKELSAYGLCHLGDYEATLFSPYSHNRCFGEAFVKGEPYGQLAEGCQTARAMKGLGQRYGVDLPICDAIYRILYEKADPRQALDRLFLRDQKAEF